MTKLLTLLCAAFLTLMFQGCANTVKYGDATRAETIETEVGVSELQLATQKLVAKMLDYPLVKDKYANQRPTIAVDPITNHTHSPIDTGPMTAIIFEKLTSSGHFRFADQEQVRTSREQAGNALDYGATTPEAAQVIAGQVNADLVFYGSLVEIIRIKPTHKETYYRVNLQLFDSEHTKLIWQDEHEILKSQREAIYGI